MTALQPTNADLMKEIKAMNITLLKHDSQISAIEHRHELIDVGKEAVAKYQHEEQEKLLTQRTNQIGFFQVKAWHLIVGILGVISLIVYAYAVTKGIRP